MEITVNGLKESSAPGTVADLVARKGLTAEALVVELNQQIIKQEHWPACALKEGDRLELLSFVGGG